MFKKFTFVIVMFCLASFAFGENKTGIVIEKMDTALGVYQASYIFLDTNNDKISDACIWLRGSDNDEESFEQLVLLSYIKIGSTIIFNFDSSKINAGLFYDLGADCIISINGIAKNRLFPLRN
ncbi:MAG: hypothetical protein LBT11_02365 [Treponema sp.]|jgi:hypothetical protein|nr:hypothetical protein [Treponema sp.]